MTGIVKGYEVKKNRDSGQNVLMLQVEISGSDDVQPVEYMSHAGDDHIPPIDSIVTILSAGKSWKIAIASNDTDDFDSSLAEGDRILYSKSVASYIKILAAGGVVEINGNADFAVAFTDLAAAVTAFVTSITTANTAQDGLINTNLTAIAAVLNSLAPGSYTPTTVLTPAVVADISAAQVPTVTLP